MSDPVPVRVGWAVWAKRPDSRKDYSVLAASTEPLSAGEYASILAHFSPGNPPAEQGVPGSLPWLTISRVAVDDEPFIGLSIQVPTRDVDATGRHVIKASYYCFRYADIDQPPVSYSGLYEAVRGLKLGDVSGPALALTAAPLDVAALAAEVSEIGLPHVATTAALMLGGPVTVVGAETSTLDQRVQYLDAVAALLPFGYRAGYSAATWSEGSSGERIRLAFASRPRQGTSTIQWRTSPAEIRRDMPAAADYLGLLARALERRPDRLPAVIRHLAGDTTPRLFDEPWHAVASLQRFDFPSIVLDAAQAGSAEPAAIRRVFTQRRLTELDDAQRRQLLKNLIAIGDPQDWATVRQYFHELAGKASGEMFPTLADTGHRLLWAQPPSLLVREYVELAERYGLADDLLAALVVPPEPPARLVQARDLAAQMLTQRLRSGGTAAFPKTRRALGRNPVLACYVIAEQARTDPSRAGATLAWLEPSLGEQLRPFTDVLGDSPRVLGTTAMQALARVDTDCAGALLLAASSTGRLDLVAASFTTWLAGDAAARSRLDEAYAQRWQVVISACQPSTSAASAWLDLAQLLSGNDPRYLLASLRDRQGYNECFAAAWDSVSQHVDTTADELLTSALARYLDSTSWAANPALAEAVADLGARLTAKGNRPKLARSIAKPLEQARPAAADSARRPSQGSAQQTGMPQQPAPGYTPAQLAEWYVSAVRAGSRFADVELTLVSSGVVTSGSQAVTMIDELRRALVAAGVSWEQIRPVLARLATKLGSGTFGDQVALDFTRSAARAACDEISFRIDLLQWSVADNGRRAGSPALSRDDLAKLDKSDRVLRRLVKDASRDLRRFRPAGPEPASGDGTGSRP